MLSSLMLLSFLPLSIRCFFARFPPSGYCMYSLHMLISAILIIHLYKFTSIYRNPSAQTRMSHKRVTTNNQPTIIVDGDGDDSNKPCLPTLCLSYSSSRYIIFLLRLFSLYLSCKKNSTKFRFDFASFGVPCHLICRSTLQPSRQRSIGHIRHLHAVPDEENALLMISLRVVFKSDGRQYILMLPAFSSVRGERE